MANVSEVGAAKVEVESFQCSIKKITASTEWKAPMADDAETVTATVYDKKTAKEGKTIYVISSPEGTDVTIKTERDGGKCTRDLHKNYQRSWDEYTIDGKQEDSMSTGGGFHAGGGGGGGGGQGWGSRTPSASISKFPIYPYKLIKNPKKQQGAIKSEETLNVKCFEIGGALEALKYWLLPLSLSQDCITKTKCCSCKEGPIEYKIIAYPDISFSLEVTVGTKEKEKKGNGRSHFERTTSKKKYLKERFVALVKEAPNVEMKFEPPVVTAITTFNNEKDELGLVINFDKDEEVIHFSYKHDSGEIEFGSEFIQDAISGLKKLEDLCKLICKLCDVEKNFDGIKKSLVKNYKPYKLKLNPPSISVSVDGQYQTSKDLTRIGKLYDICCSCDPLVSISLTIDLLFLIISGLTAGAGGGVYLMLKNLDDVIRLLLGNNYKKKYENTKPFECDIYFDLVITGAVNGDVHWFVDTTEESSAHSNSGSIEGVLSVDLKAGAKVSINYFYLATAEGEASISGSSGIKVKVGLENRIAQGDGLALLVETKFLGIIVKYCVKGKVGLYKTGSIGGTLVDGEKPLLDPTPIEKLSAKKVFFVDKSTVAGKGGGGGGAIAWGKSNGGNNGGGGGSGW